MDIIQLYKMKEKLKKVVSSHIKLLTEQDQLSNAIKTLNAAKRSTSKKQRRLLLESARIYVIQAQQEEAAA